MNEKFIKDLPISTVIYLLRGEKDSEETCLGKKAPSPKAIKRKIAGKLIGYGGDFETEKDASPAHCAARELGEESDFKADQKDMEPVARIIIKDENGPRLTLYYYLLHKWTGSAGTSDEVLDSKWYPTKSLPDNMLGSDKLILPRVLNGERLTGFVTYDVEMNVINHELIAVESI